MLLDFFFMKHFLAKKKVIEIVYANDNISFKILLKAATNTNALSLKLVRITGSESK